MHLNPIHVHGSCTFYKNLNFKEEVLIPQAGLHGLEELDEACQDV